MTYEFDGETAETHSDNYLDYADDFEDEPSSVIRIGGDETVQGTITGAWTFDKAIDATCDEFYVPKSAIDGPEVDLPDGVVSWAETVDGGSWMGEKQTIKFTITVEEGSETDAELRRLLNGGD